MLFAPARQYEVITGPQAPLEAADTLVFTRETIYNVANKHGLRATFAPRLHTDSCESFPALPYTSVKTECAIDLRPLHTSSSCCPSLRW